MTKLSKDYPSRGFPSRWISFVKTRERLSINETAEPASWGTFRDVLLPYHPSNLFWAPRFDPTRIRLRPFFTTETYRMGDRERHHLMNARSLDMNTATAVYERMIGSKVNRGKIDNLAVAILHRLSNVDEPHPSGLTPHANNHGLDDPLIQVEPMDGALFYCGQSPWLVLLANR
ncbi:hypothetical protein CSAL01_11794 [Colletotrichum salicis]|uniref:Uncharacterized protein n=1 Tax=Colletotrichum salicis TaxID=1209931 RepID=A0A135U3T3_9PEZI|nr:hypothetical protein CSAL01_11794 [Colletotrichum salicis]